MKTRKFIASAVVAGITLGGFTGLASVASATPQPGGINQGAPAADEQDAPDTERVTPNEVNSEAEELASKSAIFRYQAPGDNPPMIYIAHLSEESRAAGSERSQAEGSAVTASSLDIWGLALEQAPRSYFTWANAVKEHPIANEDIKRELNKLRDSLQKKDYAAAQETYAKTVATIMDEATQREGEDRGNTERDEGRSELPNNHSGPLPPYEVNLIVDGYIEDPVSGNILRLRAQVANDILLEGKVKHVPGQAVRAYAIDSEGVTQQADKLGIN